RRPSSGCRHLFPVNGEKEIGRNLAVPIPAVHGKTIAHVSNDIPAKGTVAPAEPRFIGRRTVGHGRAFV
ncbi:MAG TPA: hypothetical protein PL183_10235, partial [Aquamicrobium sp.]|nr:hypothetical protein [Aquamicrobium sp.]